MSLSHHPNIVRNGLILYLDAANPKSYPAGQDPYVSGVNLLFDGESLVDKSAKTQSFTNNSSVTVSTTQKKFGNSSLYFSGRTADGGSNSYLSFAANSDFGFGSGDWTVETWFYKTTPLASLDVLFDNRVGLGGAGGYVSGVALYVQAGVVKTGNNAERLAGATIATGVWNHLMISRSGNNIYLGVNGTVVSTAFSTTLHSAPQLYIGNSVVSEYAGGYMDDYRVTKGFARYTANYTAPAATFSLPGRITDLTTNKAIGTLTNGPTYSAGSLVFDGTNDYITSPTSTLFNFATGDFTIEMWVYPTSVKTFSLLDFRINETNPNGNAFVIGTSASNLWVVYQNGNQITGPTVVANQWTQVVVNRVGTAIKMFLNGAQIGSTWTTSNSFTDGAFVLGTDYPLNARFFQGRLSSVKIYKGKGLSNNEILQNYNALKGRFGY